MSKIRAKWSESTYKRYISEGRGSGTGTEYKPWLTIHSFASKGTVSRIKGRKTGRIHHLLSRNEEYYFTLLDYSPNVVDIREQFPLELSETLNIARTLNIRHPRYPGCTYPAVMTTDFLISRTDGLCARTIKMKKELDNPRTIEKFMIERAYWDKKGIDWKIVTEDQINREKALNLRWLFSEPDAETLIPDEEIRLIASKDVKDLYMDSAIPLPVIIEQVETIFSLPFGSVVALLKDLIIRGEIAVDINKRINITDPRISL